MARFVAWYWRNDSELYLGSLAVIVVIALLGLALDSESIQRLSLLMLLIPFVIMFLGVARGMREGN